jgi:2-polyprenyl-3-methyl-5-hydroxy-6-metoxy-1,4-benzoquinol methylase
VNQKELYEQQIRGGEDTNAPAIFLGRRESALLEWICRRVGSFPDKTEIRLAELSVGDGQLSRALPRTIPNSMIDCVDISPGRLEHCRRMAAALSPLLVDRMRFLELNLDTEFARLERGVYDVVVAIDILEHVFDPFHFVRNCREILKPGGLLFLRVPNLTYVKRRLAVACGRLPVTSSWFETPGCFRSWKERHGWDGGHLHFFTKHALEWLLASEGFQCLSWRDAGATAETARRIWPGMLFGNLAVCARKVSKRSDASAH